jgi:hypothetical protein
MKDRRERLLAIVVGCIAVTIVGFLVYSWVWNQFSKRSTEMARLNREIADFKRKVTQGQAAAKKIALYEERSLPANPEVARTRYQTWLVNEMEAAGLTEPDVRFQTAQWGEKDLFVRQTFSAEANGTLLQLSELLHAFYCQDWLHRITRLTLRPVKDSKQLDITIHVETLSLVKANSTDKLENRPSQRLEFKDFDGYYETLVARNFFGPRNNRPKISISGSLDVFEKRNVELTVKSEDSDYPQDQILVKLVESASPDAKLDPVTGKFTWKPPGPGKYEFVVEGIDDGYPALLSNREKFVITVNEQTPVTATITFDFAKFTMLTAVLDVNGQGEIWLHVRPTGQMVTLHMGDQFEIGTVKGTVSQIGEYDFCFDFEGKRRKLGKGELLEQAKVISDLPQVAVPATASAPAKSEAPLKAETVEVEVQAKPSDKAS